MLFQPYGPFIVPTIKQSIDTSRKKEFWKKLDEDHPLLPIAMGCYIFAIRAGRGIRPLYVGLSSRSCFKGEVFGLHKELLLNKALRDRKGTLLVYLLAYTSPGGKFPQLKRRFGAIEFLEDALIGSCLVRNSELLNKRQTGHLKKVVVPGFMNEGPGRRSREAQALSRLLGG